MSVVDASLYGRLLFGESGHAAVRELLGTGRIVGPPVLRIELANLTRRAAKHRALAAAALMTASFLMIALAPARPLKLVGVGLVAALLPCGDALAVEGQDHGVGGR